MATRSYVHFNDITICHALLWVYDTITDDWAKIWTTAWATKFRVSKSVLNLEIIIFVAQVIGDPTLLCRPV